jgi:hypothetical protein
MSENIIFDMAGNHFMNKPAGNKRGDAGNPSSPLHRIDIFSDVSSGSYCSFRVTAPVEHTLMHVSQPSHKSA